MSSKEQEQKSQQGDTVANDVASANQHIKFLESELQQTRRKLNASDQAVKALTDELYVLKKVMVVTKLGYAIWDENLDRDVFVSDELARIHGLTAAKYRKQVSSMEAYLDLVHPDDIASYIQYEDDFAADEKAQQKFLDYRIITASGAVRHLRQASQRIPVATGKPHEVAVAIQDLSEMKNTEHALSESRREVAWRELALSLCARLANLGYGKWDYESNRLISISDEWSAMFGYTSAEYLQKFPDYESEADALVHPADRQRYLDYCRSEESEDTLEVEYRCFHRDGSIRHVVQRYYDLVEEDGDKALIAIQDITDRKNRDSQILQSAKLITLGEMSTGVAHELNQPLQVIHLAAENILRKIAVEQGELSDFVADKIERIKAQARRAADIIDHMRMFGREAIEDFYEFDAREAPLGALSLIGEQIKLSGVVIDTEISNEPLIVNGHQIRLEQVFLNLLSNALQSVNENGKKKRITVKAYRDTNDSVTLIVEDSGAGIPEESLARIFEPFYTTKKMSEGTGLGLSVSYGIVRDMGGEIVAKNTAEGAQLKIVFPPKI